MEISGCEGQVCVLAKGDKKDIKIEFISEKDNKKLKIRAIDSHHNTIKFFSVSGCEHTECPVRKGENVTIQYSATVTSSNIKHHNTKPFHVYLYVKGKGNLQICGKFKIQMEKSSSKKKHKTNKVSNSTKH